MRPKPRPRDQPGWQEPDQEDDQQQQGKLDVGLNVAPQIQRHVEPIAAGEQNYNHRDQDPEEGLQELHGGAFRPAARAFIARQSRFVATRVNPELRRRSPTVTAGLRVGRTEILQKAQKLGLGAFVLLMGASLLAMRPHQASNGADQRPSAANLKLATVSPASRRDIDYRLLDS